MTPLRFIYAGLALAAGPAFGQNAPAPEKDSPAKLARVEADLKAISAALQTYRIMTGRFPTTEQGLDALINKPSAEPVPGRWVKIMAKHPADPWGHPYGYLVREKDRKEQHVLMSKGPDPDAAGDDL